ncbi:hypothetical protein B0H14DRAFT_1210663 [Mycena olivaceomarginata]|nr:hypothetical protein B0H14DRAFT_1210663 [Mycena olivaceomarginata]
MPRSIRRGQERVRARVGQRSLGRRAQGMRLTRSRSRRGVPRLLSGGLVLLTQSEREGAHRPPARHLPTSAFLSSPRPACALAFPRPAPRSLPHRFHFFLAFSCAGVPTSAVSGWARTLTLDRRGNSRYIRAAAVDPRAPKGDAGGRRDERSGEDMYTGPRPTMNGILLRSRPHVLSILARHRPPAVPAPRGQIHALCARRFDQCTPSSPAPASSAPSPAVVPARRHHPSFPSSRRPVSALASLPVLTGAGIQCSEEGRDVHESAAMYDPLLRHVGLSVAFLYTEHSSVVSTSGSSL